MYETQTQITFRKYIQLEGKLKSHHFDENPF